MVWLAVASSLGVVLGKKRVLERLVGNGLAQVGVAKVQVGNSGSNYEKVLTTSNYPVNDHGFLTNCIEVVTGFSLTGCN